MVPALGGGTCISDGERNLIRNRAKDLDDVYCSGDDVDGMSAPKGKRRRGHDVSQCRVKEQVVLVRRGRFRGKCSGRNGGAGGVVEEQQTIHD